MHDKHTARGRRLGRGEDHFFEVGALIENAADVPDPYAEKGRANRTAREGRPTATPDETLRLDV